jgi:predicted N-acyltransferase
VAVNTGWLPQHLVLEDPDGNVVGFLPCYLKTHSRGEYVFDYGFADAYERVGGRYYPKLQVSVPFTPAPGPRFLIPAGSDQDDRRALLAQGAVGICERLNASSIHITFLPKDDWVALGGKTWLQRNDTQFHWENADYRSFEEFLSVLTSRKRKKIRREREIARVNGLDVRRLSGSEISEAHWDAFFDFYVDTGSRKWGSPYLTREFFSLVGESMGEHIVLVMVERAGRYIAGALNFAGSDTLYGRNWGAIEHHDCLHFEVCYYQAIEHAIERGLERVEAGAQGQHKLARGYLPTTTYSLHHFADPGLARAVDDYLCHERRLVAVDNRALGQRSPFRDSGGCG